MTNFFKKYSPVLSIAFTLFIILLFHFTRFKALKLYPVCVNFGIFLIFFSSIFSEETIIQKFAKMIDGELSKIELDYTRNLTYIWSLFLFIQFIISVITVFCSDRIWIIYNGCISYILLGTFFTVEYIVRIFFKKRHNLESNRKINK